MVVNFGNFSALVDSTGAVLFPAYHVAAAELAALLPDWTIRIRQAFLAGETELTLG